MLLPQKNNSYRHRILAHTYIQLFDQHRQSYKNLMVIPDLERVVDWRSR